MIITTTEGVPGRQVAEVLGNVRGAAMMGCATMLSSFTDPRRVTQMLNDLFGQEELATEAMIERAEEIGADAIIGLRIAPSAFEFDNALKYHVLVCGTAVKLS
jgi:uncharacterized protein YbjQ (UPF0145 family)